MQELGVEWRALELKPSALGSSLTPGLSAVMRQDDVLMLMSALACLNCAACQFLLFINCPAKGFPVLPVLLLHVDMAPVMGSAWLTCQLYSEISNLLSV